MCLGQGADLHMAQLMPLPLTISCSSKSRLVHLHHFTSLGWLTWVPPNKIQEGRKTVMCMCVCVLFIGLGPKFLDNRSHLSLNRSPQNLQTSLVQGQG